MNQELYGKGFTLVELIEHYEALIGGVDHMLAAYAMRDALINSLRGTEFDEHAYAHCDAAALAQPAGEPPTDTQGPPSPPSEFWPFGGVPVAPPW